MIRFRLPDGLLGRFSAQATIDSLFMKSRQRVCTIHPATLWAQNITHLMCMHWDEHTLCDDKVGLVIGLTFGGVIRWLEVGHRSGCSTAAVEQGRSIRGRCLVGLPLSPLSGTALLCRARAVPLREDQGCRMIPERGCL